MTIRRISDARYKRSRLAIGQVFKAVPRLEALVILLDPTAGIVQPSLAEKKDPVCRL